MAELAHRTPTTLQELMDKAEDHINAEETIQALTEFRNEQVKTPKKKGVRK